MSQGINKPKKSIFDIFKRKEDDMYSPDKLHSVLDDFEEFDIDVELENSFKKEKQNGDIFQTYIDFTELNNLLEDIRLGKKLDKQDILDMSYLVQNKLLTGARQFFSDASLVGLNDFSNLSSGKLNIYDFNKTIIGYMFIDVEGNTTIVPNRNAYSLRMN